MRIYGVDFRKWRRERGLSANDVGELIDVHYTTVASWERNETTPSKSHRKKLRDIMEVFKNPVDEKDQLKPRGNRGGTKKSVPLKDLVEGDFRKFRRERGLTLKEVAKFVGVSEWTVSVWERGIKNPRAKYLEKLKELESTLKQQPLAEKPIQPRGITGSKKTSVIEKSISKNFWQGIILIAVCIVGGWMIGGKMLDRDLDPPCDPYDEYFHRDEVEPYFEVSEDLERLLHAAYETGDVEELEDALDDIVHVWGMELPEGNIKLRSIL